MRTTTTRQEISNWPIGAATKLLNLKYFIIFLALTMRTTNMFSLLQHFTNILISEFFRRRMLCSLSKYKSNFYECKLVCFSFKLVMKNVNDNEINSVHIITSF